MAQLTVVYWRDIPAQIIVKAGRRSVAKRELELRFIEAIDHCAMRTGLAESDEYLEQWRRADPIEVSDDIEAEAERAASNIQAQYDKDKLKTLIANDGFET
jgi:hypothetical protein